MHPLVKVLMFLFILLATSSINASALMIVLLIICLIASCVAFKVFMLTLVRMRWLFFSIFLIYSFGTPGELIPHFSAGLAPTFEGVRLALLQISRLIVALAALVILLSTTTKETLMLGLYMLLFPLKYIGLNVEKFSVRLLLTMHYVEEIAVRGKTSFSLKHFNDIHRELEAIPATDYVYFEKIPFVALDKVLIVLILLFFAGMILMRFV